MVSTFLQDEKLTQLLDVKENYYDNLTECFFLQNGGQLLDYYPWRKKPTPQLVAFLKNGRLDSDDEDENPVIYLKEGKTVDEVSIMFMFKSCVHCSIISNKSRLKKHFYARFV